MCFFWGVGQFAKQLTMVAANDGHHGRESKYARAKPQSTSQMFQLLAHLKEQSNSMHPLSQRKPLLITCRDVSLVRIYTYIYIMHIGMNSEYSACAALLPPC